MYAVRILSIEILLFLSSEWNSLYWGTSQRPTVFSGVKAAVFSGEKKSKSRGAAYTQQQQNSAVKTSRPFARMGL